MTTRVYVVTGAQGPRLIRSNNPARARSYAARTDYTVRVAEQDDLIALVGIGIAVEDATATTEEGA